MIKTHPIDNPPMTPIQEKGGAWTPGPWRADIASYTNADVYGFAVQPASTPRNTENAYPIAHAGVSTQSHGELCT